jgi:hypothetical protein
MKAKFLNSQRATPVVALLVFVFFAFVFNLGGYERVKKINSQEVEAPTSLEAVETVPAVESEVVVETTQTEAAESSETTEVVEEEVLPETDVLLETVEVIEEESAAEEAPAPALETSEETVETVTEETSTETATGTVVEEPAVETAVEPVVSEVELEASTETVAEPEATVTQSPELSTEEEDYHPGETATIFGKFFGSLGNYVLKVFGSDDNNENYVEETQTVTADGEGEFTATYQLDSLYRPFYEMEASDLEGKVLASGWFRDAAVGLYDQCGNDDGDGYATGDTGCRWSNGNLQASNSTYHEGDSTVQRLWLQGFDAGSTHTITLKYGTTKGGKHAYDFLTSWDHSENWVSLADLCQDIDDCTGVSVNQDVFAIPQDTNAGGFDNFVRNMTLRGGDITNVSTPTLVSGSYAGDSETTVTVSFTVDTADTADDMCATQQVKGDPVTSCGVALFFGAHISDSGDWGEGVTAVSIPGSPYHVSLDNLDGDSIGSRDNQMQASAIVVPQGTISGVKFNDLNGNGVKDGSDVGLAGWTITLTPGPVVDVTDANGLYEFADLADGTYTVCETFQANWTQTFPTTDPGNCTDGNGYSITLSGGNIVTGMDFGNAQTGTIVVVKNVIGNPDPTDFTFQNNFGNGNPSSFQLDEDTNGTLPSSRSFTVTAGTYSVSEDALAGWQMESATCSDGSPVNGVVVSAGETVTCTFVNEELVSITLVKNTVGGDGTFDFDATGTELPTDIDLTTVGNTASQTFTGLDQDNTYTIAENVPAGWDLTSATCTGGETPNDISPDIGEDVTCTFTNTKRPTLTVTKIVVNDNGGTLGVSDFPLFIDGGSVTSGTQNISTVGAHTVSETSNSGYTATIGGDCASDGTVTLASGENKVCTITNNDISPTLTLVKTVTNNNGGNNVAADFQGMIDGNNVAWSVAVPVNAGAHTASETTVSGYTPSAWGGDCAANGSVTLALAQNKTCTITNDDVAPTVTLVKVVINDNGGTATTGSFGLTIGGVLRHSGESLAVNANTPIALNETVVSGYQFVSMTGAGCPTTLGGTVTLNEGQNITCTITNDDIPPRLILDKVVVNDNGGTAAESVWTLTASGPTPLSGPGAAGSTDVASDGTFDAGTYTLSESAGPAGYLASDWSCVKNNGAPVLGSSITLGLGETGICTITNNDVQPKLTVTKVVVNDNGGTKVVSDFPLFVNGGSVTSGAQNGFNAGAYTVSETTDSGYSSVISGDCAANGSITLGVGDVKACTITNDDIAPRLIVIKDVINDNGGTNVAAEFTMNVTGTNVSDNSFPGEEAPGTAVTLNAGSYSVTETGPGGYIGSSSTDCAGTIAVGETKTCTWTNNDTPGHFTGGGSVYPPEGSTGFSGGKAPKDTRVTHGFTLHCDKDKLPNRLEVNWGPAKNTQKFHLLTLDTSVCTDNPAIDPQQPRAEFDTIEGTGTGRYNGVDGATVWFKFDDNGEPGKTDRAWIKVWDKNSNVVLDTGVTGLMLNVGNHQAHQDD